MEIVRRVHSMREISYQARKRGLKIGFVPTMGYLHDGHLSLIRAIEELTDVVIVSVFVNPTQFGPEEDFERYPRDLTRDTDLCISEGVEYLFVPEVGDLYPPGPRVFVDVEDLATRLEGASRPGHFRGVATVVLKLLNIIRPNIAGFGLKDAQQVVLVRRLVQDLMLDVEILALPIVRDEDGLAVSSRNSRLTEDERAAALAIPRALEAARARVGDGAHQPAEIVAAAREVLEETGGLKIDYVELVDPAELRPLPDFAEEALLLVAAWAGEVRLIDNTLIEPPPV